MVSLELASIPQPSHWFFTGTPGFATVKHLVSVQGSMLPFGSYFVPLPVGYHGGAESARFFPPVWPSNSKMASPGLHFRGR